MNLFLVMINLKISVVIPTNNDFNGWRDMMFNPIAKYYNKVLQRGYDLGYTKGVDIGQKKGFKEGQIEGYDIGFDKGEVQGYEKATNEINHGKKLYSIL